MADKIRDIIYRKALGMLNIQYDKIRLKETTPDEVSYCADNIETACHVAMSSGEFFWLISSATFTDRLYDWVDTDGNVVEVTDDTDTSVLTEKYYKYHGFEYGYNCPDDLYKPFLVEGKYNSGFARKGKEIYFAQGGLTLDYIIDITKELDNESWDYPTPFLDLVACLLAINIAPMVAPEGTFGQNAANKMQTALSACMNLQKDAYREYRPSPKEYLE